MYKIGQFAKKLNISIRTLRYYDAINLFKPDNIDIFTGYRYYSDKQINEYKKIMKLKNLNFSLEEIKIYRQNPSPVILKNKRQELMDKINLLKEGIVVIDDMINKENKSLKIVKATKDELLKKWGEDIQGSYLYEMISKGNCDYFVIYQDNEFFDDFWLYLKDENLKIINDLCINGMNGNTYSIFDNSQIMKKIFDYLKPYKKITITLIDEPNLENRHERALQYGFQKLSSAELIDYQDKPFNIKIYEKIL